MRKTLETGLMLALSGIAPAIGQAADLRIVEVRTELFTGEPDVEPAGPDYVVNAGTDAGLEPGTLLAVYRLQRSQDPATGLERSLETRLGWVEVLRSERQLSVARVHRIEPTSGAPLVEPRAVMLGDRLAREEPPEPPLPSGDQAVTSRISIPARVLFDLDSSELKPGARAALAEAAAWLADQPEGRVTVEGHTCDLGGENYNLMLSLRRARSVANFLGRELRVPEERLSVVPFGEGAPRVANTSEQQRRQNRRVDLRLTAPATTRMPSREQAPRAAAPDGPIEDHSDAGSRP